MCKDHLQTQFNQALCSSTSSSTVTSWTGRGEQAPGHGSIQTSPVAAPPGQPAPGPGWESWEGCVCSRHAHTHPDRLGACGLQTNAGPRAEWLASPKDRGSSCRSVSTRGAGHPTHSFAAFSSDTELAGCKHSQGDGGRARALVLSSQEGGGRAVGLGGTASRTRLSRSPPHGRPLSPLDCGAPCRRGDWMTKEWLLTHVDQMP